MSIPENNPNISSCPLLPIASFLYIVVVVYYRAGERRRCPVHSTHIYQTLSTTLTMHCQQLHISKSKCSVNRIHVDVYGYQKKKIVRKLESVGLGYMLLKGCHRHVMFRWLVVDGPMPLVNSLYDSLNQDSFHNPSDMIFVI